MEGNYHQAYEIWKDDKDLDKQVQLGKRAQKIQKAVKDIESGAQGLSDIRQLMEENERGFPPN